MCREGNVDARSRVWPIRRRVSIISVFREGWLDECKGVRAFLSAASLLVGSRSCHLLTQEWWMDWEMRWVRWNFVGSIAMGWSWMILETLRDLIDSTANSFATDNSHTCRHPTKDESDGDGEHLQSVLYNSDPLYKNSKFATRISTSWNHYLPYNRIFDTSRKADTTIFQVLPSKDSFWQVQSSNGPQ